MADEDKYPVESDRRRFVKGVVGAAAVAGFGASGAAAVNTSTPPSPVGGGVRNFMGTEMVDGPAPNGMPQIPLQVDDEGYLQGIWPETEEIEVDGETFVIAEEELGGIEYSSEWYHYCGGQTLPGLAPTADQENYFHYSEITQYEWQQSDVEAGDRIHIDDFEDYMEWEPEEDIGSSQIGKPATATWRSEGDDIGSAETVNVFVLRSELIEEAAAGDDWLEASTDEGFIAIFNTCTHFCCIPGWKVTRESMQFGTGDEIYCQCHQSVYDPFTIMEQSFVALPREDEDDI